jgi:hypothetical protein
MITSVARNIYGLLLPNGRFLSIGNRGIILGKRDFEKWFLTQVDKSQGPTYTAPSGCPPGQFHEQHVALLTSTAEERWTDDF